MLKSNMTMWELFESSFHLYALKWWWWWNKNNFFSVTAVDREDCFSVNHHTNIHLITDDKLFITAVKPSRITSNFCFKISKPKQNRHSAIDEKTKNFSNYQKESRQQHELTCWLWPITTSTIHILQLISLNKTQRIKIYISNVDTLR